MGRVDLGSGVGGPRLPRARPGRSPACDHNIEADIEEFVDRYPGMSRQPQSLRSAGCTLAGRLRFHAELALASGGSQEVRDAYAIEMRVPAIFPEVAPLVFETGGRIVRDADHHVLTNGALCLGSPMRLNQKAAEGGSLLAFTEECLIPYLCAACLEEQGMAIPPLLKELAHGRSGLVADYLDIFDLKSTDQLVYAMRLLLWPQDMAYAQPCPCACGRRLGFCHYRQKFDELQARHSWSQIRRYLNQIANQGSGADLALLPPWVYPLPVYNFTLKSDVPYS